MYTATLSTTKSESLVLKLFVEDFAKFREKIGITLEGKEIILFDKELFEKLKGLLRDLHIPFEIEMNSIKLINHFYRITEYMGKHYLNFLKEIEGWEINNIKGDGIQDELEKILDKIK